MTSARRAASTAISGALVLLLAAGCTTTVSGTATVDTSAAPRPATGSFPTVARQIGQPGQGDVLRQEVLRMLTTVPFIADVVPEYRFGRQGNGGAYDEDQFSQIFGEQAARAFSGALMWGTASAEATYQYSGNTDDVRGANVGLIRMESADAARGAVTPDLIEEQSTEPVFDVSIVRTPISIPGQPDTIAYTSRVDGGDPADLPMTFAYTAIGPMVSVVFGELTVEQVATLIDQQTAALADFVPTPMADLPNLAVDESGVATLTLPPDAGTGYSVPTRSVVQRQSDVLTSRPILDDNGVDIIAQGGNVVYRARDEAAARTVGEAFIAEITANLDGATAADVPGVPGASCVTFRTSGSDQPDTATQCVAFAGRYVAEYGALQAQQAIQGIGASYLILRQAPN